MPVLMHGNTPTAMLLEEEELRYVGPHREAEEDGLPTVYVWQHRLTPDQLVDLARCRFPLLPFERYEDFKQKRLVERLSVDMLACALLGQRVRIGHEATGRPFAEGSRWEISVSHTGRAFALSVGRQRHGLDIEGWGSRALRISRRFLLPEELPLLCAFPTLTEEQTAVLLWSAKEAVYKMVSTKEINLISDICLQASAPGQLLARVCGAETFTIYYSLYPSFVCTLCV